MDVNQNNNSLHPSNDSLRGTVLFLTSSYPKDATEPSGIFLHYLNRELAALGWTILVVAPSFPGGKATEEMDGITVLRFTYFIPALQKLCYRSGIIPNLKQSPWLWLEVPFYFASMFWRSCRLLQRLPVDVICAHWILPQGVVAAAIRRFYKVPLMVTAHGSDMSSFEGRLGSALKRFVLSRVKSCSANSQYTSRQINLILPQLPVEVIPMGVDPGEFRTEKKSTVRKTLGIGGEFLLFVGRLVQEKGPLYLLKALPPVLEKFPRTLLVLAGGGTQRRELEHLAEDLGITHAVRFLGRIPHQELACYYSAADVFVGPSLVEGLGIVFLEAAASGLPIVGSRVGGVSDILIDGVTGIEVEPANSGQLANAIIRLLDNPELRRTLANNARQHVEQHFTWKQVALRFDRLLRETMQRKANQS
jgi:glycosyltransferase involved in cell wall biosynthesis